MASHNAKPKNAWDVKDPANQGARDVEMSSEANIKPIASVTLPSEATQRPAATYRASCAMQSGGN